MKNIELCTLVCLNGGLFLLSSCGHEAVRPESKAVFAASRTAVGACQGIDLPGRYVVVTNCRFGSGADFLAPGRTIELAVQGDATSCTFAARADIHTREVEYSITPPPGVIVGPYDMCALWAFDEGSRPGSFPAAMREACRIWMSRPPDRIIDKITPVHLSLPESQVRLDVARRVSNIGDCAVRR